MRTIDNAPGGPVDANGAGAVVGDTRDGRPWVASAADNGAVRILNAVGKRHAIDADGRIAGSRLAPTSNGPPVYLPAVWAPGASDPVDLPMPSKETGYAADVSMDGTMVGVVAHDRYDTVAVVGGAPVPLPAPDFGPGWRLGHQTTVSSATPDGTDLATQVAKSAMETKPLAWTCH